jgi:hypothetical protein
VGEFLHPQEPLYAVFVIRPIFLGLSRFNGMRVAGDFAMREYDASGRKSLGSSFLQRANLAEKYVSPAIQVHGITPR